MVFTSVPALLRKDPAPWTVSPLMPVPTTVLCRSLSARRSVLPVIVPPDVVVVIGGARPSPIVPLPVLRSPWWW